MRSTSRPDIDRPATLHVFVIQHPAGQGDPGQATARDPKDSGLTARELASRAGWHESKCSRIENGRMPPSDDDLRMYTLHCAAADQTADLIATARNIDGAYVEWRRI
ncbi:helix-turn-helix domain-containing protein [Streptomyces sp. NPDC004250]|uniref:helix-turn-helix domain-containing protein n=1 Tax=Streptomyces sp. NPDC004250 TaxID=3364692 RepID=UPI0036A8AB5C